MLDRCHRYNNLHLYFWRKPDCLCVQVCVRDNSSVDSVSKGVALPVGSPKLVTDVVTLTYFELQWSQGMLKCVWPKVESKQSTQNHLVQPQHGLKPPTGDPLASRTLQLSSSLFSLHLLNPSLFSWVTYKLF